MNRQDATPRIFRAGGNWRVIDEVFDPTVVQQQDRLSCGPASAEMLLKALGVNEITQALIASETGTPVDVPNLARAIDRLDSRDSRHWIGGCLEIPGASDAEVLNVLIYTGSGWQNFENQGPVWVT